MPSAEPLSLHQVKADWLRIKSEMAYVRFLIAAYRLKATLEREAKFNPYHDNRSTRGYSVITAYPANVRARPKE